jgi:hypothetical protein
MQEGTNFFFFEICFTHGNSFDLTTFENIFQEAVDLDYGYDIDTDVPTETIVKFQCSQVSFLEIFDKIEQLDPNMGYIEFTTELEIDDVYVGQEEDTNE